MFAELGLDPKADYQFATRMTIQEAVLKRFAEQYSTMPRVFVADRTPIDLMAYTLADITREGMTAEDEERLSKYLLECVRLNNKYFSVIVVVQPGIPLVDDPTKAPISNGYIEHIANLTAGLAVQESISAIHSYIPRATVDINRRVYCVEYSVKRAFSKLEAQAMGYNEGEDAEFEVTIH